MACVLCSLVLLVHSTLTTTLSSRAFAHHEIGAVAARPVFAGYLAEVEVMQKGAPRHGRIMVTRDGCIHVEHLDDETCRWVVAVIRQQIPSDNGWAARPLRDGTAQIVWGRLGTSDVPTELHTREGSLKLSQHRALTNR